MEFPKRICGIEKKKVFAFRAHAFGSGKCHSSSVCGKCFVRIESEGLTQSDLLFSHMHVWVFIYRTYRISSHGGLQSYLSYMLNFHLQISDIACFTARFSLRSAHFKKVYIYNNTMYCIIILSQKVYLH